MPFQSNIDITNGGAFANIEDGQRSSVVAQSLNGRLENTQNYLQNLLPEVYTGAELPTELQNGKIILYNNFMYFGDTNNQPRMLKTGGGAKREVARFLTTDNWVCPEGITEIDAWVCGGGGAGGAGGRGASANGGYGGMGGRGGECKLFRNIPVVPNQSYECQVGLGGQGVISVDDVIDPTRGNSGTESYFIGYPYQAAGGYGGKRDYSWSLRGGGQGGKGGSPATNANQNLTDHYYPQAGTSSHLVFPRMYQITSRNVLAISGNDERDKLYNVIAFDLSDSLPRNPDNNLYKGHTPVNPYDGFIYGIGGNGAPGYIGAMPSIMRDLFRRTCDRQREGNKYFGGKPNFALGTQSDFAGIDGDLTCGGGGSAGGVFLTNTEPHRSGSGGNGLVIIYA